MNFIKRLFTTKTQQETQEKREFTPRADRVRLAALHRILFRPLDPPFAVKVNLSNLSTTGAGFIRDEKTPWPGMNAEIEGDIEIESVPYRVSLKVVRVTSSSVGCVWVNPDPAFISLIRNFFEAELAALKLFDVDPKFLKAPPGTGQARWIQGDNNCEIYFVKDGEAISYFNIFVLGNYVEGGEGRKTRFGSLKDLDRDKPVVTATEGVEWNDFVSEDLRESVLKFLSNVPTLKPAESATLSKMVRK